MGWIAFLLAALGGLCLALPSPGMFVAIGLGLFAIVLGVVGFRRRQDTSGARLAGAAGITVGLVAVGLSVSKFGLTIAVISKLESLF